MKITSIVLAGTLLAGLATPVLADHERCAAVAADQWMSIERIVSKVEAMGYRVTEAKRSKGCWEVEGRDRNGAEIELRLDPVSGEVVRPRDRGSRDRM